MRGVLSIALLLGACAPEPPAIIDGTTPETFARTTEAARRDLPVADRLDFDRAIATVPGRRYGNRDSDAAARTAFGGMTGADVVATERERTGNRGED